MISLETRRSLQWWLNRQVTQRQQLSNRIQDELMQDLFTIRRSLELSLINDSECALHTHQRWLTTIEALHDALEQLSHDLSPPYVEESLPLAIQALAQRWRSRNPALTIETYLPRAWHYEPCHCNLIVIIALNELLTIVLSMMSLDIKLQLVLNATHDTGELLVQISYPSWAALQASLHVKELQYLSHSFRFLTSGSCFQEQHHLIVKWYFRWCLESRQPM